MESLRGTGMEVEKNGVARRDEGQGARPSCDGTDSQRSLAALALAALGGALAAQGGALDALGGAETRKEAVPMRFGANFNAASMPLPTEFALE